MACSLLISCLLLTATVQAAPAADASQSPRCKEVRLKVSGAALDTQTSGVLLDTSGSPVNLTDAVHNASTTTSAVQGQETFAGWFCNPTVTNANSTKLQILRGSFFTNREAWTALGGTDLFNPPQAPYQPATYSWFDFANALGYPTLAIDNLGDGASSRPDGLLVAQIPYDISLYHDLVTQIRAGTTGQLPQAYSYLIHVGNSIGSAIGNWMAAYHPGDFDLTILTGYTKQVDPSLPGVGLNLPAPAALVDPVRFAGLPLDYVTSTVEAALTGSFFGSPSVVDFDPQLAHLFFQRRDVISLGYTLSQYLPGNSPVAPSYTGRVLLLTGENDAPFCGIGSSILYANTTCGSLLKDTGVLFPAADYNYQSVPKTGHAIIQHKSARFTMTVAHQFIAGGSFGAK